MELTLFLITCLLGQSLGFPEEPLGLEDRFMNDLLSKKDEEDRPKNMIIQKNSKNVNINCKTDPGVSKIVWRIETISDRKFIAVIAENGRVTKGWRNSHAINATLYGQNTLIIKKASMKNAGKYSCQLYYKENRPVSYQAEVIILEEDPETGITLAPGGYFKWTFKYNGNLKPYFKCSNNEVINGVQVQADTSEDMPVELTFNGCFLNVVPSECTLLAADLFNNKFTIYKVYNMSQEDKNWERAGSRNINVSDKISTFSTSSDRVLKLGQMPSIEFECDFFPTPDEYSWVFTNPDRECYTFELHYSPKNTSPPFKYHIVSPTPTSSHFIIFNFNVAAAGRFRCVGTYWSDEMRRHYSSMELSIVVSYDDLIIMFLVEGSRDIFIVRFEISYRGNLKPYLQCSSAKIEMEKMLLETQDMRVSILSKIFKNFSLNKKHC